MSKIFYIKVKRITVPDQMPTTEERAADPAGIYPVKADDADAALAQFRQTTPSAHTADFAVEILTLPADPDGMNEDRTIWADAALHAFSAMTGSDHDTVLLDLLTDLMHWCDRNGSEFTVELAKAQRMYAEETTPCCPTAQPA